MRLVPPAMQAALQRGVTHFCHCWLIRRADGTALGLTDHDADLEFDGRRFHADAGLSLSALETRLGLAAPQPEAGGVLSSRHLQAADLAAGLYDHAQFDLWLVDWQDPANRLLLSGGRFGAVRLQEQRFTVQLQPAAGGLEQPRGRLYQTACDAALGDARCRADVSAAPFRRTAVVQRIDGPLLVTEIISAPADWFAHGHVETSTGKMLGIRADAAETDGRHLHLWQDADALVSSGDRVAVLAGCDKTLAACRSKFNNAVNHQGFPDLSDDRLLIGVEAGA